MSSNQYPESPENSSPETLPEKSSSVPESETVTEPEKERTPVKSLFATIPTIPTIPEKIEPTTTKNVEAETTDVSNEVSEVDEAADQVEEGPSESALKYFEGGPWEIIKHTGYLTVTLWALFTAAITGAAAHFFTPGEYTWIALAVLGFMTGVVAAVDKKTHLIKNQHTILTATLTVPLALIAAFNLGSWNFMLGVISAVIVFGVFVFLVYKVNFGSGGDIKFSPVPAFALGVVNPLISALWLFYALIITVVLLVVRKKKSTSFGEGMALSLPLAIISVYGLYSLSGLPYMQVTP